MQEAIKLVNKEVIDAQKDAVVKEVATLQIQLGFIEPEHDEKVKKAMKLTKKEEREHAIESLAQAKLQKITPMKDNIEYKGKYYDYLCTL